MEALLRAHADVNGACSGKAFSPLLTASFLGHAACVESLLAWGARSDSFAVQEEGGAKESAITFAMRCERPGGPECVALLKRHEEDEEFLRSNLALPLQNEPRPKSAAKLKKSDQQQKKLEEERLQRIGERLGETLGASSAGKADTVQQLRLRLAVSLGDDAYIAKWLRDGGREALRKPCLKGTWILTAAAARGHSLIVERLLKARASPEPPDDAMGNFPLLASCSSGSMACINALLEHSADPQRVRISDGRTPMQQAVLAGHEGCDAAFSAYERLKETKVQLAEKANHGLSQALSDITNASESPDADFEALLETPPLTLPLPLPLPLTLTLTVTLTRTRTRRYSSRCAAPSRRS